MGWHDEGAYTINIPLQGIFSIVPQKAYLSYAFSNSRGEKTSFLFSSLFLLALDTSSFPDICCQSAGTVHFVTENENFHRAGLFHKDNKSDKTNHNGLRDCHEQQTCLIINKKLQVAGMW